MSIVDHYDAIFHNPVVISEMLETFYSHLGAKEKSLLLAYLVLPLSMSSYSKESLQNLNSRSSLRTFLQVNDRIIGVQGRIKTYWQQTSNALQYSLERGILLMDKELSITTTNAFSQKTRKGKKGKEVESLAKIFQPLDVVSIYRMLGVKSL